MQFTKDITKAIRQWLKDYNFDSTCRLGSDMECDPNEHIIYVPYKYNSEYDCEFMVCLRKLGLQYNFDAITLSILHELGHCETEYKFNDKQWENFANKKQVLQTTWNGTQEKYLYKYWNISDEKQANKWLINFVSNNYKLVEQLENIIEQGI